ncbi:MAG TPA: AEC family transporter [Burkholderiales bacterium]|nr:AEC family transporter [Burkholderiales bacterium]
MLSLGGITAARHEQMNTVGQTFVLSAPFFGIVFGGYLIAHLPFWRTAWTELGNKFVFAVALPAMLFRMMSDLSALPVVDARLLVAFFGGCLIVFVIGRFLAASIFRLDGVSQSVFALGGVYSNHVLLGLPLAKLVLGSAALPSVALVLVFNALTLWTLVSVSVEWARHGSFTPRGLGKTALGVLTNPIVASIIGGTLFGLAGLHLPGPVSTGLDALGKLAAPAALLVLGMGLLQYGVGKGWQQSLTICLVKLVLQPLVVWGLALALKLPALETRVVVLMASMSVGANVYLMAVQFQALQGAMAGSLVLSTALAALTTPILLAIIG